MDEKLTAILTALRRRLVVHYGARLVQMILFGSQARGDATPGSGIDVLVVLKDPVNPGDEIGRARDIVAARWLRPTQPAVASSLMKSAACIAMVRCYATCAEKG